MQHLEVNDRGQIIFASPHAFLEACIRLGVRGTSAARKAGGSWTNGESLEQSLHFTAKGNPARVAPAQKIIEGIQAAIELEAPEWQHDVAGAYPDVAAFLAGQPENMRRRVVVPSEKAPVRIWSDVVASAGIDAKDMERRGAAATALVMALIQRGRAVELYTFTSCNGNKGNQTVACVRQLTSPFDVANVAHCLSSSGFARTLCYGLNRRLNGYTGGWSPKYRNSGAWSERVDAVRKGVLAGLVAPQDVVIPAPHFNDLKASGGPGCMFVDPVKWVNDRVAECMEFADASA